MNLRVLVIGSNRGIGLEICRQLCEDGATVHAACRSSSTELQQVGPTSIHSGVDVCDSNSIKKLADSLGEKSVDWLIVVAGILQRTSLDNLDMDSIRRQFEVNAMGPLLATTQLLPCLSNGSKVGLLTSRMGSIEDNTSGGAYGYRMSKAALNSAGKSLSLDLKDQGIAVRLLHPGWVRTEMTGGTGYLSAEESAAGLIERMHETNLENSGSFVHCNGDDLPW